MSALSHVEPGRNDWLPLLELSPDALMVAALDGRLIAVNDLGCRLLGYERLALDGTNLRDLIAPDHADRLFTPENQLRSGDPTVSECQLRRADGAWVWAEVSARTLPDGRWLASVRDISARKARDAERDAYAARTESDRQWLKTFVDTVPLAVLILRPSGEVTFNRRTEELLGLTLSPTGGSAQYASRVLFPDGRPVPADRLPSARALGGETVNGEEYLIARPDGSQVPILGSTAPIRDGEGRIVGAAGVFQDISDRMRVEGAIRDDERLLQDIIEILPVGVWLADQTGQLLRTNPAAQQIWRGARFVSLSEYGQYKGWWVDTGQPIAPEDWGMARAITRGETSTGELIRIQCFDGTFKTIIHSAMPLRDASGGIRGAIVVNEDITALHEAQQKLRESEQLLRTVFDLLPVGLWVTDRDGQITLANPAGDRIWGGVRYIGLDQYASDYKGWWIESGRPIGPDEWGLRRAIRNGETSRGELIRIQAFDGSFKTIINWAAPIRSAGGDIIGAVAVNEDVSSLQHTQEQLRASVRDREQILAIVMHDLRTPLNSIMMSATLAERLARGIEGAEAVRARAASIVEVSRRMSGLVDDLLAVGLETTGGPSILQPASVAAAALLARAADGVRPLVEKHGLELEIRAGNDLPHVTVDEDRLLRVFANLLDNAVKYTPPPGRIVLAAEPTAGSVRFSVANSGPPLPREQLDAMFRPFWQAVNDRRGAGLGLSICRSIVEAHGGSIWAEPAEGQRVRVSFVVPR